MLRLLKALFPVVALVLRCNSFSAPSIPLSFVVHNRGSFRVGKCTQYCQADENTVIEAEHLMEMDVVIFSEKSLSSKRKLGAVQNDGRIMTLCVWTMEPAFGMSLECLVDEEDLFPGFNRDKIDVHSIVPQNLLSYGSRQVGGGMGPGNPHGEESELLYYIDESLLSEIEMQVKPELEIFW